MNKLTTLLVSSALMFSAAACSNVAKTSPAAPDSIQAYGEAPDLDTVLENKSDAMSDIRRAQANSDIRAREQRYNTFRQGGERADDNVESEVRSKLEVNIPSSQLTVNAEDGVVTVAGIVQTQEQLARIEPLAQQIRGVKSVNLNVKVGPDLPPYRNN
jgi:hyperosmotically inducible periplasmic protein